jgi:hypothetical protein
LILGGIAGLAIGSVIAGNRQVVNRADDRIVVLRPQGDYQVIRDDDTLLRRPGNNVFTETFADGSSRNVVTQPDGTQVITVRDRDLRILRRTVVAPDGTRTILIDDIAVQTPVVVSELPTVNLTERPLAERQAPPTGRHSPARWRRRRRWIGASASRRSGRSGPSGTSRRR